jgi:hypothetical protein
MGMKQYHNFMPKKRVRPPAPEYLQFLAAYGPDITRLALATRRMLLEEASGAWELIYDAYNAVAAGYSFTERPSDAFIHIAAYANWVNLGFNFGSSLHDPEGVLQGAGKLVRHVRISSPEDLESARGFVRQAIQMAKRPSVPVAGKTVVRAIYEKRRRPAPLP